MQTFLDALPIAREKSIPAATPDQPVAARLKPTSLRRPSDEIETHARNPMIERREPAQKIKMMLAPDDDVVEIVARGDGGAGQQQQRFGQGVDDPLRLACVRKPGEMPQKQGHARPRNIRGGEKIRCIVRGRPQ